MLIFYGICIHQSARLLLFILTLFIVLQFQSFGCASATNEPSIPSNVNAVVSAKNPLEILVPLPLNDTKYRKEDNPFGITQMKVIPVLDAALEDIYWMQLLPYHSLSITLADSKLSDTAGPNAVISALVDNKLDCVIGFASDYALGPVARITPGMRDSNSINGIPVITTVGMSSLFENRSAFPTLTRISAKEWTTETATPKKELPTAYKQWEEDLHLRAEQKFQYSRIVGQKYEINRIVEAFYDALMLYAYAVNESLASGRNPRNGVRLTKTMRNRCFERTGILVCIDANGDRTNENDGIDGNFSFFRKVKSWSDFQSVSTTSSSSLKCKSYLAAFLASTDHLNCTIQHLLVFSSLAVLLACVAILAIRIFHHFVRNKKWKNVKGKADQLRQERQETANMI